MIHTPQARSWRDIPQQLKPRAMSSGGRRRVMTAALRVVGVTGVGFALAWGLWVVADSLQENPRTMPVAAKNVPVRNFELTTDGVLDKSWLLHALALPKGASLMELDLQQLRARLLAHGQVNAATLMKNFPDTLGVHVTERSPIARVAARFGAGEPRTLLVARDGVVFDGVGFAPADVARLPWLDGVKLVRQGEAILPIAGMRPAAELLATARFEADHLCESWQVISLARLPSDGELEIRTKAGVVLVFKAGEDLFPQLARLNYLADALANQPTPARIDLSLGREVPVTFNSGAGGAPNPGAFSTQPASPAVSDYSLFPNSTPTIKREL